MQFFFHCHFFCQEYKFTYLLYLLLTYFFFQLTLEFFSLATAYFSFPFVIIFLPYYIYSQSTLPTITMAVKFLCKICNKAVASSIYNVINAIFGCTQNVIK